MSNCFGREGAGVPGTGGIGGTGVLRLIERSVCVEF